MFFKFSVNLFLFGSEKVKFVSTEIHKICYKVLRGFSYNYNSWLGPHSALSHFLLQKIKNLYLQICIKPYPQQTTLKFVHFDSTKQFESLNESNIKSKSKSCP